VVSSRPPLLSSFFRRALYASWLPTDGSTSLPCSRYHWAADRLARIDLYRSGSLSRNRRRPEAVSSVPDRIQFQLVSLFRWAAACSCLYSHGLVLTSPPSVKSPAKARQDRSVVRFSPAPRPKLLYSPPRPPTSATMFFFCWP
jgi:hypothetical protein